MTARYVLTSACIQTGTMALTVSLRQRLLGREQVRFVDEDGEAYTVEVDWKAGVLRGLGPYYQKRRLSANETVLLLFRGEEVELKAAPRPGQRPPAREREARPEEVSPLPSPRSAGSGSPPTPRRCSSPTSP